MRLFQGDLPSINDYNWARGKSEYEEKYKEQLAEADAAIAKQAHALKAVGVSEDPTSLKNILWTERQMLDLLVMGFPLKVTREIPIEDSLEGELIRFRQVAEKMLARPSAEQSFNSKVEVHMPGQALSLYNEILLLEDDCSDDLQSHLDDGWRIIAACPQPDQRRPDYIMGRFNPERDSNKRAQRKYLKASPTPYERPVKVPCAPDYPAPAKVSSDTDDNNPF